MAFEGLSSKLSSALSKLTSRGKLTEQAVKEGMRDVRMALLEADVNYLVVKDFCKKVTERCVGQQVLDSLSPAQQVMKIVSEEMTALMGSEHARLTWSSSVPTIYMLCGLQGAGKTTMAGKLANYLQKQGKKPLLAACDIYRPAAIKQLQVVGSQVNVPVYEHGTQDPVKTAQEAIEQCRHYGRDVLIIDTAGRLQIDTALMEELRRIKAEIKPQEILFVVDAMTGQEAVNVAKTFDSDLGVDGVILTKLDGDTRGGAALSIKAVTGKPIKFSGTGEKLSDIEPFYPDRMASRILGMGDMMTLIEKAQEAFDEKEAEKLVKRGPQELTLEDFLSQMQQMNGRPAVHAEHAARRQQAAGRGDRRKRPEEAGSHHPQHDPPGAPEPRHSQRQPPQAYRGGQRHHRAGRERPHSSVRAGQGHDEENDGQQADAQGKATLLLLKSPFPR